MRMCLVLDTDGDTVALNPAYIVLIQPSLAGGGQAIHLISGLKVIVRGSLEGIVQVIAGMGDDGENLAYRGKP